MESDRPALTDAMWSLASYFTHLISHSHFRGGGNFHLNDKVDGNIKVICEVTFIMPGKK